MNLTRQPEASGIRQMALRKVDTMEQIIDIRSAEVKETEMDQVSGGVYDITPNELYKNGNEMDLLNTDFLPKELIEQFNNKGKI